jgi:DNA anti-recombination protein RmuC
MHNELNDDVELLPIPGPFGAGATPDGRAGAYAAGTTGAAASTDAAIGTEIMPDDIPMIVWLRGDEEFFNDFSVDADAAMAELGIRRSRLTQISGRELRVGKKRVDRYIRPYFRPQDVAAYKNFTRATVSHMKSSQVLDDVLARLEAETGQLIEKVAATVAQNAVDFKDALAAIATEFRHAQGLLLREVTDRVDTIERGLDGSLQAALLRVQATISSLSDQNAALENRLAAQNETMLELANQNHLMIRELNAAQGTRFEALAGNVTGALAGIETKVNSGIEKAAGQIETSIHQTRLALRGDLRPLLEKKDEPEIEKNSSRPGFRRARGGGHHARRMRYGQQFR